MRVLGVIPARYASSRFPGKPLIDLKGKSMIQRVYEGASACPHLTDLVVATDDERILDHVLAFGGKAVMTREQHSTGTERCEEVAKDFPDMEVIVNIQGDEPLVQHEQLSTLIELFHRTEVTIGTLIMPISDESDLDNPHRVKVVTNQFGEALCFSRKAILSRTYPSGVVSYRHLGLYAYRNVTLAEISQLPPCEWEKSESLEQLRWLYAGHRIHTATTLIETPNIDCPEDVEKVLKLIGL
ncbi:MAG: 3-deoxy-manno-octulosonate cytidylyltransferase [Bacteroidetes bacterium]|nr:3-deoxy-manno-octulosonate cytidylyltransferase [Bacteroidota bacterium]